MEARSHARPTARRPGKRIRALGAHQDSISGALVRWTAGGARAYATVRSAPYVCASRATGIARGLPHRRHRRSAHCAECSRGFGNAVDRPADLRECCSTTERLPRRSPLHLAAWNGHVEACRKPQPVGPPRDSGWAHPIACKPELRLSSAAAPQPTEGQCRPVKCLARATDTRPACQALKVLRQTERTQACSSSSAPRSICSTAKGSWRESRSSTPTAQPSPPSCPTPAPRRHSSTCAYAQARKSCARARA